MVKFIVLLGLLLFTVVYSEIQSMPEAYALPTFVDSKDITENNPHGLDFNNDGTKMYVVGRASDTIREFECTTGFDLSTCGAEARSVATGVVNPRGVAWSSDGSKVFVTASTINTVREYDCTTNFKVDTCSFSASKSISGQDTANRSLSFNDDGTKMYVAGKDNVKIYEYSCTAFTVTCSHSNADDLSVTDDGNSHPADVVYSTDGTKMFLTSNNLNSVMQYSCLTAFDTSTCSYQGRFSLADQTSGPDGLQFNTDGTKMFILSGPVDSVYEYTLDFAFDVITATLQIKLELLQILLLPSF